MDVRDHVDPRVWRFVQQKFLFHGRDDKGRIEAADQIEFGLPQVLRRLERAGFQVRDAEYPSQVFAAYICIKR